MKTLKILLLCLVAGVGCISCDDSEDDPAKGIYPVTAVLGEGSYSGTIVYLPNPPDGSGDPILPGTVLGLETPSGNFILTSSGHWFADDTITVGDGQYSPGEEVKVTGTLRRTQVSPTEEYTELEIATIERRIGTDTYPYTSSLGEGTFNGAIVRMPNPPDGSGDPILPGTVLGLETPSGNYILSSSRRWFADDAFTLGRVEYTIGDAVEIVGELLRTFVSPTEEYTELEIATIRKRD